MSFCSEPWKTSWLNPWTTESLDYGACTGRDPGYEMPEYGRGPQARHSDEVHKVLASISPAYGRQGEHYHSFEDQYQYQQMDYAGVAGRGGNLGGVPAYPQVGKCGGVDTYCGRRRLASVAGPMNRDSVMLGRETFSGGGGGVLESMLDPFSSLTDADGLQLLGFLLVIFLAIVGAGALLKAFGFAAGVFPAQSQTFSATPATT